MTIYKIRISNLIDNTESFLLKNFKNEIERLEYQINNSTEGNLVTFENSALSLFNCLNIIRNEDFNAGNYNDANYYYKLTIEKFGIMTLKSQFPDEMSNIKLLLANFQKMIDKQYDEYENAMKEHMERQEEQYFNNYGNPEIDAADEEMRKWDDEDPTWRIANDFD